MTKPDNIIDNDKQMSNRARNIFIIFFVVGVLSILHIVWIQFSPDGKIYRARAYDKTNFMPEVIPARRGAILSCDERILTATLPSHKIYMDFAVLHVNEKELLKTKSYNAVAELKSAKEKYINENLPKLAQGLSNFFKDKSKKEYLDYLNKCYKAKYRYRKVSPYPINDIELGELLKLPIFKDGKYKGGVIIETDSVRVFPFGNLARRLIGHINKKGIGAGVEYSLDSVLTGTNGVMIKKKVSGNFWVPMTDPQSRDAVDGLDIVTTIDVEVQDVAEMMLRKQVVENNAKWGTAILMDVKSGEIRAMANYGFREEYGKYGDYYNYGLGQNMEPGSTFKLISLMALLEDAKMTINTMVDCGSGTEYVNGAKIRDTRKWGYGVIPLTKVFQVSSNIGFSRSVVNTYKDDPNRYINFIRKRNFDKPFNFELVGEGVPYIKTPYKKEDNWSKHSLSMIPWGYESKMTPLHILSVYNSVANDGVYVKPRIIKGYKRGDEYVYRSKIDTIYNGVCSKSNIRDIKYTMEQVVNDGTAKVLLNPNYKVAGKTGTSQVYVKGGSYAYDGGMNYLATVVGYFPAENPKYACIVSIELFHKFGSSTPYYGGSVSGPVFRAIADKVYSHAIDWGNKTQKPTKFATKKKIPVKEVKNNHIRVLKGVGDESIGSIARELNMSFTDRALVMYSDSTLQTQKREVVRGVVPNVVGMGLRDAVYMLGIAGYKFIVDGSGEVVEQIPAAGDTISVDSTKVKIILKKVVEKIK